MWQVAPESKIQLLDCELSQKFPLVHLLLTTIFAIDAYIFWSLLFSALFHAQLPFSFKRTFFRRFSFSFDGFGNFVIR